MSIFADLKDFIGSTVTARDVEYKGNTRSFNFRELTAAEAETLFLGVDSDPKKNKGLRNRVISKIVVDAEGNPALTESEAGALPNELANAIQKIALEVNGIGGSKEEAKNE